MIFKAATLGKQDEQVVAKIVEAKASLGYALHVPRRWTGLLRRSTLGRAIRGSNSIEGYDDVLQGWGEEDRDLYTRLRMIGTRLRTFPGALVGSLPHEAAARVAHYAEKNQWLNRAANRIYCRAKFDLMLVQQGNLPRQIRAKLYDKLHTATLEAHADGEPLEIGIPLYEEDTQCCGPLEARLVYRLPRPRGNSQPAKRGPAASSGEVS